MYKVAPPAAPPASADAHNATAFEEALPAGWTVADDANNVNRQAVSKSNSSGLVYLGSFKELDGCVAAMVRPLFWEHFSRGDVSATPPDPTRTVMY